MPDVAFLRNRAREYRRLAEAATDEALIDSYRLLAEIDEAEADKIEKGGGNPPPRKPGAR
ncbi:MAG TPA: hypothetical protein VMU06_12980 [Stellaceae bacterium]|nr:hypothetical protein [Stellaceae bacterium]